LVIKQPKEFLIKKTILKNTCKMLFNFQKSFQRKEKPTLQNKQTYSP